MIDNIVGNALGGLLAVGIGNLIAFLYGFVRKLMQGDEGAQNAVAALFIYVLIPLGKLIITFPITLIVGVVFGVALGLPVGLLLDAVLVPVFKLTLPAATIALCGLGVVVCSAIIAVRLTTSAKLWATVKQIGGGFLATLALLAVSGLVLNACFGHSTSDRSRDILGACAFITLFVWALVTRTLAGKEL